MSHDGLPARAGVGARAARADRRASSGRLATLRHVLVAGTATFAALVVAACGSTASGSGAVAGATGSPAASTEPSVEASVAPSAPTRLSVSFKEANGSKIFGGGFLTDLGDSTSVVTLGVVAIGFDDPLPTSLEQGNCATIAVTASPAPSGSGEPSAGGSPEASAAASAEASAAAGSPAASGAASAEPTPTPGPVTGPPFQLKDVVGGSSNTVIATSPGDLLSEPFAIVIRKSATDTTVLACADVTNTPPASPAASAEASAEASQPPAASEPAPSAS